MTERIVLTKEQVFSMCRGLDREMMYLSEMINLADYEEMTATDDKLRAYYNRRKTEDAQVRYRLCDIIDRIKSGAKVIIEFDECV